MMNWEKLLEKIKDEMSYLWTFRKNLGFEEEEVYICFIHQRILSFNRFRWRGLLVSNEEIQQAVDKLEEEGYIWWTEANTLGFILNIQRKGEYEDYFANPEF